MLWEIFRGIPKSAIVAIQVSNWLLECDEVHWRAQVADTLGDELRKLQLLCRLLRPPETSGTNNNPNNNNANDNNTTNSSNDNNASNNSNNAANNSDCNEIASQPTCERVLALVRELTSSCKELDALAREIGVDGEMTCQTSISFDSPPSWAAFTWSICSSGGTLRFLYFIRSVFIPFPCRHALPVCAKR